jgi:NAD dependent epimerase/dehydratase family enzyme
VNVTGPEPARNADLVATLARLMHRPAVLPVPAFVLKTVLGGLDQEILIGQRAIPKRLLEAGFSFRHPTLEAALQAALSDGSSG